MIVEKSGRVRMRNVLLRLQADRPRLEELGLFDVGAMHFVQLPVVPVRVDDARILYIRVDLVHVLDAPVAARHGLRQREKLVGERVGNTAFLDGEEDGHEGEAYPLRVFCSLEVLCEIVNAMVDIAAVPLVQ